MKEPLECLLNVVGVADTDCDCYEDGRPENYDEASSGLHLSQLVDLDVLAQVYQCAGSTIWITGAAAIKEATNLFQSNLLQCWARRHNAREKWSGLIGQKDCPKPLNPSSTYAGQIILPKDIAPGVMEVTHIGTIFTLTGAITVRIYDQLTDTFLYEVDLDTTANTFQSNALSEAISLPFSGNDGDRKRYWMLYEVGANKPKEGDVNCGCSSLQNRMKDWAEIYGTQGNTLSDRRNWTQESSHYGLLPTATFKCDVGASICDEPLDFTSNPHAGVIAEAIWYLSASKIPGMLRRSSKVLPGSMLPGDDLQKDMEQYMAEYQARVKTLCETMKPNDCFLCKPTLKMAGVKF